MSAAPPGTVRGWRSPEWVPDNRRRRAGENVGERKTPVLLTKGYQTVPAPKERLESGRAPKAGGADTGEAESSRSSERRRCRRQTIGNRRWCQLAPPLAPPVRNGLPPRLGSEIRVRRASGGGSNRISALALHYGRKGLGFAPGQGGGTSARGDHDNHEEPGGSLPPDTTPRHFTGSNPSGHSSTNPGRLYKRPGPRHLAQLQAPQEDPPHPQPGR